MKQKHNRIKIKEVGAWWQMGSIDGGGVGAVKTENDGRERERERER